MRLILIKKTSSYEIFDLAHELAFNQNVMFCDFLYPFVDTHILNRREKSDIYFYDRLILNESCAQILKNMPEYHEFNYISGTDSDIFPVLSSNNYGHLAFDPKISVENPVRLRKLSRILCALTETTERILIKHGGKIILSTGFEILFDAENDMKSLVLDDFLSAKSALFP